MTDQSLTPQPTPKADFQMRDALALASTLLFTFTLAAPLFVKTGVTIDADLKGAVIMQWAMVMGFYFGTSKGSVAKDATIASALTNSQPPTP